MLNYQLESIQDTLFLNPHIPYITKAQDSVIYGYPYNAPPFLWQFPRLSIKNISGVEQVKATVIRCQPVEKAVFYIRTNQLEPDSIGFWIFNLASQNKFILSFGLAPESEWADIFPGRRPKPYRVIPDSTPCFIDLRNRIADFLGTDMRIIAFGEISSAGQKTGFKTRVWLEKEECGIPNLPLPECNRLLPQQNGKSDVLFIKHISSPKIEFQLCSQKWMKYLLLLQLLNKEGKVVCKKYINAEIFVPKSFSIL